MIQKLILCLFLSILMATGGWAGQPPAQPPAPVQTGLGEGDLAEQQAAAIDMLQAIVKLQRDLKDRMADKKRVIGQAESETEKKYLASELEQLDKQLASAVVDFERIATGVDVGVFAEKKADHFNWKDELVSLVEPGIMEIKRLTVKARHKTKLKDQLSIYQDLVPVATKARNRVEALHARAQDPLLKSELERLVPEYRGVESQINNKLNLVRLQLEEIEREEISLLESSQASAKKFVKTRGLYLVMALAAALAVVFSLRLGYRFFARMLPGYRAAYRPFHTRAFDLIYRVLTLLFTLIAVILVFYVVEDWVLLSLAIILLMGIGWAAKHTLPRYIHQSRLMLNIGPVREGERMVYEGVPWLVRQINVFTTLENPDLGATVRLPIDQLMDKVSRPFHPSESWFPCRKGDWVILSDGTRGCVTALSHEMVEVVQRGGAKKTYQTADFLSLSPLNISVNFRLKTVFGISYSLQAQATGEVPRLLESHVKAQIHAEGYGQDLLNLRVEFASAGASSLDLVIIADFKGSQAPLYNRLSRALQRWCVDAATIHGWEIPFPQLTVHRAP